MAVTSDIGHPTDVHPKNKKDVGERLARWALNKNYGQDIVISGPLFQSAEFSNGKAIVEFEFGEKLQTPENGPLRTFELAGMDKIFHHAKAEISGDKVIVWCDLVQKPAYVRYGWQPYSTGNLINGVGLPASTFSSEY